MGADITALDRADESWVNPSSTPISAGGILGGLGIQPGIPLGLPPHSYTPARCYRQVILDASPQFGRPAWSFPIGVAVASPTPFPRIPEELWQGLARAILLASFGTLPTVFVLEVEQTRRELNDALAVASRIMRGSERRAALPATVRLLGTTKAIAQELPARSSEGTELSSAPDGEERSLLGIRADQASIADATAAADELRRWLGLTYEELEAATGIGRTTFHYWRREGGTPRPITMRKLLRVHALARAVVATLGADGARTWFSAGPERPLDLLLAGKIEAAEEAAAALLFRGAGSARGECFSVPTFAPEPEFDIEGAPPPRPLRRAPKRARRERRAEP